MYIAKKLKKYSHRSQQKNADLVSRLTEIFNNIEVIKANSTEKFELKRFSSENWHFFGTYSKIQDAIAASERVFEILDTKATIIDSSENLDNDIKSIDYKNVSLKIA